MLGTQANPSTTEILPPHLITPTHQENTLTFSNKSSSATQLSRRAIVHNSKAGLNPLVDAASYLFTVIGNLKRTSAYRQLNQLQKELIHEINHFHEVIKHHGYHAEYMMICRYVLCATLDDVIANTPWGGQGQWDSYSMLLAFNQDTHHQSKFFTILDRALKEPARYIDLMEFVYICLSMGYKGQYRATEHSQYQLEQITNNLYKHIRSYRGNFSKSLSPVPFKTPKSTAKAALQKSGASLLFIFFVTACTIMTIFIGLDYLMDVISNEAYKNITQIKTTVSQGSVKR